MSADPFDPDGDCATACQVGSRGHRKTPHLESRGNVLCVDSGDAESLLSVERLSFTYGDKPVELRRGLYNTDQHFYRNELN